MIQPITTKSGLDQLDFQILWHLDNNAKMPLAELARHVGISRQTLNYRVHKLTEEKVLTGFIACVDIHRLGFLTYRAFYRFKNTERHLEAKVLSHLVQNSNTLWVVSAAGNWDIEVVFTARNFIHFNNIFKAFNATYGYCFSKYNISMSPVSYHFRRDYLVNAKRKKFTPTYYGFEPQKENWDEVDFALLRELSKDCRKNNEELADSVGVTAQTVKQRIIRLEESRVIPTYRVTLDLTQIGRQYVKVMLVMQQMSEKDEKKIYNFCAERNYVIYLTEVLGDWQMEIEAEVADRNELSELLEELRQEFPEKISDYQTLEVTKEHKMNYFPMGDVLTK